VLVILADNSSNVDQADGRRLPSRASGCPHPPDFRWRRTSTRPRVPPLTTVRLTAIVRSPSSPTFEVRLTGSLFSDAMFRRHIPRCCRFGRLCYLVTDVNNHSSTRGSMA